MDAKSRSLKAVAAGVSLAAALTGGVMVAAAVNDGGLIGVAQAADAGLSLIHI